MKLSVSQRLQLRCSVETALDDTLDSAHWIEFTGWGFIPGIVTATQRTQGPVGVSTQHDVHNSDGSHHTEEVVALDRPRTHTRRIFGLTGIFSLIVRQMEELWTFTQLGSGCVAERVFRFDLTTPLLSPIGLLLLVPFCKAMQRHAEQIVVRL